MGAVEDHVAGEEPGPSGGKALVHPLRRDGEARAPEPLGDVGRVQAHVIVLEELSLAVLGSP